MSAKIDRKSAMRTTLSAEKKDVNARFAAADAVLAERPSGLAVPVPQIGERPAFSAESSAGQGGQIIEAPLDLVYDNPLNARRIYKPDVVKELAASIATRGQKVAATAVLHPDIPGAFMLVDGHYRKRGVAAAGLHAIKLVVERIDSDIELYRTSWVLNEERSAQSALDNAFAWRGLLDSGLARSESHISELLGLSLATVNKTLALLSLPPKAVEKMSEHPERFGVFIGYELSMAAKRVGEEELLNFITRIVDEELSSREVAAFRAKLESGRERKRKETSRQYKIQNSGQQIGLLKEWDSGKVAFEVVLDDPKARAALVAELMAKFGLAE